MDVTAFETWLNSVDGEAFIQEQHRKKEIKDKRHRRFEEWLEENDFDKLICRLILEHDDDYMDKCYKRGYMPYPNRKLSFLIGYIIENIMRIRVSELDSDFGNEIWFFKGYYFQHIHGQGTIFRLYNKDDMKLILQV